MRKLSTFNKIFLVLCAALITLLAFTVPHEQNEQGYEQTTMQVEEE